DQFEGKSTIERHRMVYIAVDDLMRSEIHALSIKALTPEEI
ncbi:MAG: BolA/IbaG family iron-sulfur metabolism protein, partial [Candidatus Aminicenantes bacterium]|nr:BolA/IbaG family iron-sulfur metabolism protein [Candidatus Aminicenantes bacterium]